LGWVDEPGVTDTLVCEALGIGARQLRRWRDSVRKHGTAAALPGHGKSLDDEVTRLKRELAQVKQEWDILRAAARYFAKEST